MFTWTTLASVVPKLEPIMKALVVRIENDYRCRQPRKQRRSLSQRVTWRVTDVRSHHLSCSQESTPNATTYLRRCGLCATTQPRYNALNAPSGRGDHHRAQTTPIDTRAPAHISAAWDDADDPGPRGHRHGARQRAMGRVVRSMDRASDRRDGD